MSTPQPSTTPLSDEALEQDWQRFQDHVRARVEQGKCDYGDSSFERPITDILKELQQEIADINGWGFIAYSRIERYLRHLDAAVNHEHP